MRPWSNKTHRSDLEVPALRRRIMGPVLPFSYSNFLQLSHLLWPYRALTDNQCGGQNERI